MMNRYLFPQTFGGLQYIDCTGQQTLQFYSLASYEVQDRISSVKLKPTVFIPVNWIDLSANCGVWITSVH